MFFWKKTESGDPTTEGQIGRLKEQIESADAIVIGAGAGLSSAAGLTYSGQRFKQYFGDFETKYGFHDMYAGGFYPFQTPEEHWAYWSRFVLCNRYEAAPRPVYQRLLPIVEGKDYFVLTTNVDHQFQKSGFDKTRLFYTQGDYGLFQCSIPCCQKTFDNQSLIRQMGLEQKEMRIPKELIPVCPMCGKPMTMNLRKDDRFVEDDGWHSASRRYQKFLQRHQNSKVLFWELGVGYNTPSIIKYPFWHMTAQNSNAHYACLNDKDASCPQEIMERSTCIHADIGCVLEKI